MGFMTSVEAGKNGVYQNAVLLYYAPKAVFQEQRKRQMYG